MRYSVWNYGTGSYDYYQSHEKGSTHAPTPPRARGAAALGATPEQAAWPLPAGAVRVGSGPVPKGRIATSGVDAGGFFGGGGLEPLLVVGAGAAALWWLFGKGKAA